MTRRRLRGPFRFDSVAHRYWIGGTEVPGIHACLRAGGMMQGYIPEGDYLRRGRAVHYATLRHDLGHPHPTASPDWVPEWTPYLDAWTRFRRDVACRWRWLEHPRVHRGLWYASIVDRVGIVGGHPAVVEIKTGFPADFHGPQLAGADLLVTGRVRIGVRRRLGVYLYATGTYQVKNYDEAADYYRFMEAVQTYWREEEA